MSHSFQAAQSTTKPCSCLEKRAIAPCIWAFRSNSDRQNTIMQLEMLSANRNSHPAPCARCPHQPPDRAFILRVALRWPSAARRSAQMLRYRFHPQHICQGERFRTNTANSKGFWARVLLACISPQRQLVSTKKRCLITLPWAQRELTHARVKGTHAFSAEFRKPLTFMFWCNKQGNPNCDYFAFPSF